MIIDFITGKSRFLNFIFVLVYILVIILIRIMVCIFKVYSSYLKFLFNFYGNVIFVEFCWCYRYLENLSDEVGVCSWVEGVIFVFGIFRDIVRNLCLEGMNVWLGDGLVFKIFFWVFILRREKVVFRCFKILE